MTDLRALVDGLPLSRVPAPAGSAGARALDEIACAGVTIDSRKVHPGVVFVACPGATPASKHGHEFLDAAVHNGAAALVVTDAAVEAGRVGALVDKVPVFVVDPSLATGARGAAALLAERAAGEPSKRLQVVGVTGTNGKTTTTWLLAQIFAAAGKRSAVLGTLGAGPVDAIKPLGFTTPEAEVLSRELARLHRDGVEVVAMEVSSHALATSRVDGIAFAAVGFTNLTRDHLDFHGSMDAYFEAKARLFTAFRAPAVVPGPAHAPDDAGRWHAKLRALRPDALAWGVADAAQAPGAGGALTAVDVEVDARGVRGVLVRSRPDGGAGAHAEGLVERAPFTSPLLGGYNIENLLVAAGCALACGLTLAEVAHGIATATAPPGRLQRVSPAVGGPAVVAVGGPAGGPVVVVDYAHTPDALARALQVVRPLAKGRVLVVFGAGGDRDPGKRALMGRVAGDLADVVIVTDDNPRTEDGDAIADAILAGVGPQKRRVAPRALVALAPDLEPQRGAHGVEPAGGVGVVTKIRARRMAIRAAIAAAHDDDVVLVAGKGHERGQTFTTGAGAAARAVTAPFDDVTECARALRGEGSPAWLDAGFVVDALQGRGVAVEGSLPAVLAGVSTDSRRIEADSLFVALSGDRFDGHTFVTQALAGAAGAAGTGAAAAALIAHGKREELEGAGALVVVDDTLRALQDLARAHLARLPGKRLALTGSNGKTTTKELLAACLRAHFGAPWVLATEGNLNNHIGVPLTALRCEPEHEALVFEMGMNHLGEIALLADLVQPHVGLVTNMGTAHAGNVGGAEGVARAKAELFEALSKVGAHAVAVVNADDARCVREAQRAAKCQHLSFGRAEWADVRLVAVRDRDTGGQELELAYASKVMEAWIPLEGRHNAGNAAGAVAAAIAAGVPFEVAARGLATAHHAHGRLERVRLGGDVWLLDDTYNANPDSMEAALTALGDLAPERRKVVVLGEMRELGALADAAHRHIGAAAAQARPAALLCCGAMGKLYGEGAVNAGLSAAHVVWAPDNASLAPQVVAAVRDGDVVLVKGSRGARMEVVVDALRSARGTGALGAPGASGGAATSGDKA